MMNAECAMRNVRLQRHLSLLVHHSAFCVCFCVVVIVVSLGVASTCAFDPYLSPRLGVSLTTLQTTLAKVTGPVTFVPRPGSSQGTQEARLPENAGFVQASSSPENLSVIVLWLPVDTKGKLAGPKAKLYLGAFVGLFTSDSEPVILWIEQVLQRAIEDGGSAPQVDSLLLDQHQFKTSYLPTLSPPMLSLTVTAGGEDTRH
jgi:hypothetical protein